MLDFDRYEWLSFDCYGTLVDWETGISTAVAEVLRPHGVSRTPAEILALFADAEPRAQTAQGYQEYRPVLREVMALMGAELDIERSASRSWAAWPTACPTGRCSPTLPTR